MSYNFKDLQFDATKRQLMFERFRITVEGPPLTLMEIKAAILRDGSWRYADNIDRQIAAIKAANTWQELRAVAPHNWHSAVANRCLPSEV
jgi:hypothetical protein